MKFYVSAKWQLKDQVREIYRKIEDTERLKKEDMKLQKIGPLEHLREIMKNLSNQKNLQ